MADSGASGKNLTVAQLKEELKKHSLSTKGLKAELEQRLREFEQSQTSNQQEKVKVEEEALSNKKTAIEPIKSHEEVDTATRKDESDSIISKEKERKRVLVEEKQAEEDQTEPKKGEQAEPSEEVKQRKKPRVTEKREGPKKEETTKGLTEATAAKRSIETKSTNGKHEEATLLKDIAAQVSNESSEVGKTSILLRYLTDADDAVRTAGEKFLSSTLFLFQNEAVSSYEEELLKLEALPEVRDSRKDEARRRFFERAGTLQRIAYRSGVDEAVYGAPSESVSMALQKRFWVAENVHARSAFVNALGADENIPADILVRALEEYFATRKPLAESAQNNEIRLFKNAPSAEIFRLFRQEGHLRPARSIQELLARLAFLAKAELAFPFGGIRKFAPVSKVTNAGTVLVKDGSVMRLVDIGQELKGEISLLTAFGDRVAIGTLQIVQALLSHESELFAARDVAERYHLVAPLTNPDQEERKKRKGIVQKPLDLGVGCISTVDKADLLNLLKRAFPGEVERVEEIAEDSENGNHGSPSKVNSVILHAARKTAVVPSAGNEVSKSMTVAQLRALRVCLYPSSSSCFVSGDAFTGKTELAAQLVVSLLHLGKRVLVLSGRGAPVDLLRRIRKRSTGSVEWRDMFLFKGDGDEGDEDHPALTFDKYIQRLQSDRQQVLGQCKEIAKTLGVEDAAETSCKSCASAVSFLAQAERVAPAASALSLQIAELKGKVEDLRKTELFLFPSIRPQPLKEYLVGAHCKIVGASLWNAGHSALRNARFDFVIVDDCSSSLAVVALMGMKRTVLHAKLVCFSRDAKPQFHTEDLATLDESAASGPSLFLPGFLHRHVCKLAVSLKEEADLATALLKYARKLGYSEQDVLLAALTAKQAQTMDSAVVLLDGDETKERVPLVKPRIIICSTGGKTFSASTLRRLLDMGADGLVIITCDKNWSAGVMTELKDDNDKSAQLELVLGEKVWDEFDPEIRSSTVYAVDKPGDLVAVVANL